MNNDLASIDAKLIEYIEGEIIPRYRTFDKAHSESHARQVITRSIALAQNFDTDAAMVYTIAAYHDLGLCEGRERHHIVSGEILTADTRLRQFFSEEQIATMREAVEDHRASSNHSPRSIYGRIVAEADRLIDAETIVRRTIQYSLSHYPTLTAEGHFKRCVSHLHEKYGRNGYLRLWIEESDNARRLEELRQIIEQPQQLRLLFEQIYNEESH